MPDIETISKQTEPIRRFPRIVKSTEELLLDERARLEARAWQLFATRSKVRLEIGRTFIQLKATFKHGEWIKAYYAQKFRASGVGFRTVQRWMKMAREADKNSKNDKLTHFPVASDSDAVRIREATTKAEAEVGLRPKPGSSGNDMFCIYRLPLRLTREQRDRTDALRRSPKWPRAERRIVDSLDRLHVEFGVIK